MKKKWIAMMTAVLMTMTLLTACGGNGVSDKTYETVQQNWKALMEFYNEIASAYNTATSNGEIERDETLEGFMNEAADVLEEIQKTPRADLTEEKAIEINDKMIRLQEELAETFDVNLVD